MLQYSFNIQKIDQYGYHPFIPFFIEGKRMNALIDTGASCNFLCSDYFTTQGQSFDEQQATGFGDNFPVESYLLGQLDFSGRQMSEVMMSKTDLTVINEPLIAMGLKKADGILGSDFLEYLKVSIDFVQRKLLFGDRLPDIPFWYDANILQPTITILLNGHPATLIIDTGASQTILDTVVAETLLQDLSAWEKNENPSVGISPSDILESKDTSSISFEDPSRSWSTDFIAMKMHNINKTYDILGVTPVDAIIGADFLIKYGVRIDFMSKTLVFP